jgi:hypothetical protein
MVAHETRRHMIRCAALISVAAVALHAQHSQHTQHSAPPDSSAFTGVQQRGGAVMGVDQYTSQHQFDLLPTGARIRLQRDVADPAGTRIIREHMRLIATEFAAGDFRASSTVHAQTVPGTDVLRARRAHLRYRVRDLPRGAEVRIITRDSAALAALGEFVRFQRMDHRAGGMDSTAHRMHHTKP